MQGYLCIFKNSDWFDISNIFFYNKKTNKCEKKEIFLRNERRIN